MHLVPVKYQCTIMTDACHQYSNKRELLPRRLDWVQLGAWTFSLVHGPMPCPGLVPSNVIKAGIGSKACPIIQYGPSWSAQASSLLC